MLNNFVNLNAEIWHTYTNLTFSVDAASINVISI